MRGDAPIPIPLRDGTGSPGRRRRCSSHQMGRRRRPRPGTPHRAGSLQGRRVRVGYPGQQGWGGHTKGSPEQLGQQPPAGVGSGWEQVTGQLTASQSTRPPYKGTRRLSPTSGWCGRERHGGGRGAHLASAAPAPRLYPASAGLPGSPPVPTARGGWGGGTGGCHGARGWLGGRGCRGGRGGRELGTGCCGREVGRGGAPGGQEGSPRTGREQDEGGRMLQGLQDGRWGQDGFGVA